MSSLLFAELAATCNALGYFDGTKYYIDLHCKETIKDLIRYLRRDDENHEVRRYLGEAKILQSDLLPILKDHWKEAELFDVILRLLVNLTNPALLLYREELPAEKTSRNYYLQIVCHLQSYKEAFTDEVVWNILSKKLTDILQIESVERDEDKGLTIERILILIRNILQVPADPEAEKRADNEASVHDQVLWALHQSGMVDIFLYIASSENEQQYYMHILEIVSLMLRDQNPTQLADAAITRSAVEKERDEMELLAVRQEEIQQRQQKLKKFTGARHSRFGGTYVLKDIKSISNQDLIYHKPLNRLDSIEFDRYKKKAKRPKNRLPMKEGTYERRSAFSIRLFLKEFCVEFLNGAYNSLMHSVKDTLARASSQAHDESYYLWAMKFFMEFNRHYKFQVKLVSETMSVQTFYFVQRQLENYYETLVSDRKKIYLWSRRMHLGVKAYQELLMTLNAMDKSEDPTVRESSKVIKSNIFYIIEYRELMLTLMLNFDEVKFSKAYLKDLIETVHVFLKLLEHFCSKRTIVVQKKKVVRKQKKKKSTAERPQEPSRNPEELWDEVGPQLSVVLQNGNINTDIVPFDAASDRDIDEQKADAMRKIQSLLREHHFEDAVGLMRASREVWPENDSFGSATMAPEEEFMALREIFMADIQGNEAPVTANPEDSGQEENEEDDEENEEEESATVSYAEQDFHFMDFAKRFAHSKVVHACSYLLQQFDHNVAYTNHCIIKLLHRIAWDCKLPGMLFQASLFRTFQRILDSKMDRHKELMKFAIFIIRKFTEVAQKNNKVFMELLFWKTAKDAFDIENGYGSYDGKTHSAKQAWGEEEEDELRRLYQEYMSKEEQPPDIDVVDWIQQNLINNSRTHRGISKKLKELGFNVPSKAKKKTGNARPPKVWAEEEEEQLRSLYEELKNANDPLGCIVDRLNVRRPKPRIAEKLLEMGLVQDKKELRKKRTRKSKGNASGDHGGWESAASDNELDSDVDSSDSGGSDSDGGNVPRNTPKPGGTQQKMQTKPAKKQRTAAKKSTYKVRNYSSAEVASALNTVITKGMSEPLKWVSESLEEVAEDREADGDEESVPLLPLSEDAIQAMDNPDFLNLLRALGIMPPSDEQETYWRIPGHLNHHELRNRISVIKDALEGRLHSGSQEDGTANYKTTTEQENNDTASLSEMQQYDEDSVPGSSASTPLSLKPSLPRSMQVNSDSEPEMPSTGKSKDSKEPKKRKTWAAFMNSESESEDKEVRHKNKKSSRIIKPASDDSNSEDELANQRSQSQNETKTSENNEMNSKTTRSSLLDSDSESENNTSTLTNKRTRRALTDSESDTEKNHVDPEKGNDSPKNLEAVSKSENKTKRLRILNSDDED